MYYHQSLTESHPNLVLKFTYLKFMDTADPFNISGLYGGKESEVYVTALINYKTPFMVTGQPVTAYLALIEGVSVNTIFS